MKALILTPYRNEMCGMYQLAKDLRKEFNGNIMAKGENTFLIKYKGYTHVITFLYPMHTVGKKIAKDLGISWICYDQKVPPANKSNFPNFFRRQYIKWFYLANERSKKGADEYWELSERQQKPRFFERKGLTKEAKQFIIDQNINDDYAIYLGRTTDYKNFDWLQKTMQKLKIPLIHPKNTDDATIHILLSNAKMLVTASTWEGYGRPCNEAQALNIPVVCFDVGVHKKLVKNGFVIPNYDFKLFEEKTKELWKQNLTISNSLQGSEMETLAGLENSHL